jgi:hypothetical protein
LGSRRRRLSITIDHDAGRGGRAEDLAIGTRVTGAGIEALDLSVLPRPPRLDAGGPRAGGGQVLSRLGNEFRAIIGPDVLRHASEVEGVGEDVGDVGRGAPAVDPDRQAFPRELMRGIRRRYTSARPALD